ncbi:MAG TPA: hypothetical protein VK619_10125 [Pyrinomonadaceae bacterium]|nr:hypothetical protein [Pyrinomonadaceae bacterium]
MATKPGYPQPLSRPLKIYAFDPMVALSSNDTTIARSSSKKISVDVANEKLAPGPQGARIEVIDYDGPNRRYYTPVDLNDPAILMQGGLEPAESDPHFHQQMVYAVAMKVLENFDHALGRKLRFLKVSKDRQGREKFMSVPLRIFPHAFWGANAFYDHDLIALLFGYFNASAADPGQNMPGQTIFTCLSHDIIAHEMTHALVDRLKKLFTEPSNRDVLAFHEGFADIVAIFQHFSFPSVLREFIQKTRANLRENTPMVTLAQQFGRATGIGDSLRSAIDEPDPRHYETATEVHTRGSILVAAVFEAFFVTYQRRIDELIHIATGGTGILPEGDLFPELVNRIANEASQTAQSILTMCIRAFDYLPPVDITFGDYLRALVTADRELLPEDQYGQRAAAIEAFRRRGIYAKNVFSLAEESLLWECADEEHFEPFPGETLREEVISDAQEVSYVNLPKSGKHYPHHKSRQRFNNFHHVRKNKEEMRAWAKKHAAKLGLDPALKIDPIGFHASFRISPQGQLVVETVAQFVQTLPETANSTSEDFGGVPFRAGCTVIASADGSVRYVIRKPMVSKKVSKAMHNEAAQRLEEQRGFVNKFDSIDPRNPWYSPREYEKRVALALNFEALHRRAIL